jgi:hypothetical protein
MKFDGKQYLEHGLDVPAGSTSSGRRVDSRTLETADTEKREGRETPEVDRQFRQCNTDDGR